jgi:hypothetical protein
MVGRSISSRSASASIDSGNSFQIASRFFLLKLPTLQPPAALCASLPPSGNSTSVAPRPRLRRCSHGPATRWPFPPARFHRQCVYRILCDLQRDDDFPFCVNSTNLSFAYLPQFNQSGYRRQLNLPFHTAASNGTLRNCSPFVIL